MNLPGFLGSINCVCAVALGAFGAHKLKDILTPEYLDIFNTGAEYQFYHGLALLAIAWAPKMTTLLNRVVILFQLGIFFFSGSLYVLSITGYTKLGMVTPIGGVSFLIGWGLLAFTFSQSRNNQVHSQQST